MGQVHAVCTLELNRLVYGNLALDNAPLSFTPPDLNVPSEVLFTFRDMKQEPHQALSLPHPEALAVNNMKAKGHTVWHFKYWLM